MTFVGRPNIHWKNCTLNRQHCVRPTLTSLSYHVTVM